MMSAENPTESNDNDHPPVILVVEDEALIRAITADYLRDSGFTVLEAADAEHAIALIRAHEVAVVFSDVRMPGDMDGFGLARWVHKNRPRIRVLLTSGGARVQSADRPERLDFAKPYDLGEVACRIRRAAGGFSVAAGR